MSQVRSRGPRRVLVTGGAGYVGSACLRALRRQGIEAYAFDSLVDGNRAAVPADRLFVGDVRQIHSLTALMVSLGITDVLHMAALTSVSQSIYTPGAYWDVNLDGTRNVLTAMRSAGVKRIVLSSTAAVYAGQDRPIAETDPTCPLSAYGASKLAAEHVVRDHAVAHDLCAVALRYFNAAGSDSPSDHGEARREEGHVIPRLMTLAARQTGTFRIFGTEFPTPDGSCIRDYVSVQDLADAHVRALFASFNEPFTVCNLGSGHGVSVISLLRAARRITGCSIPHRLDAPRMGDPASLVASIDRARALLQWHPTHSGIDDILRDAWRWHSRHPSGYGSVPGATAAPGPDRLEIATP